jgi:hypothetical protein
MAEIELYELIFALINAGGFYDKQPVVIVEPNPPIKIEEASHG